VRWLDWLSDELYDDELSDALRPCMECWSWLCRFNSARELKCCRHVKSLCFIPFPPRRV